MRSSTISAGSGVSSRADLRGDEDGFRTPQAVLMPSVDRTGVSS